MARQYEAMDQFLIDTLTAGKELQAAELEMLTDWWQEEATEQETLVAFFVKQGVLTPSAPRTMDLMQRGYLRGQGLTPLLTAHGLNLVRERFRDAATSATRTLPVSGTSVDTLSGDRTPSPSEPRSRRLAETSMIVPRDLLDLRPTATSESSPPERRIQIGDTLGKCLLTEFLGQGGCCQVYRALHKGLNIPVAVKVLRRAGRNDDDQVLKRFQAEARLLAQLDHPNVIRVLDFEGSGSCPYLVLELVQGLSLHELIQQSGRLQLERAVAIMLQTLDGLAAAWQLDVVHRDVKPSNILLTRDGTVKLADLGLALSLTGNAGLEEAAEDVIGTVIYMSPEQAMSSADLDERADIYSLGATFYHALTGQIPFQGKSCQAVLLQQLRENPVPPVELVPEIGRTASDLVLHMMAKDPNQRPQDAAELSAALQSLVPNGTALFGSQRDTATGVRSTARSLTRPSSLLIPPAPAQDK